VSEDTVVLFHPAFVESAQIDWLRDPERSDYLASPLAYYPMPGRIEVLPYTLESGGQAYLDGLIGDLADEERFLLVTRYPGVPYREYLEGRLGPEQWTSRQVGTFGIIQMFEFMKDEASPLPA
jgi:hypothetical protein